MPISLYSFGLYPVDLYPPTRIVSWPLAEPIRISRNDEAICVQPETVGNGQYSVPGPFPTAVYPQWHTDRAQVSCAKNGEEEYCA